MVQIGHPGTRLRYAALAGAIASMERVSCPPFADTSGVFKPPLLALLILVFRHSGQYSHISRISLRIHVLLSVLASLMIHANTILNLSNDAHRFTCTMAQINE